MRSSDVHRDLLSERVQRVGGSRAFERDEDADLAESGRDLVVNVGNDSALAHFEHGSTAQRLVLANRGDVVGQLLRNSSTTWVARGSNRFDVSTLFQCNAGDVANEILEDLVLGDEVGFGVHLDDRSAATLDGNADEALGGRSARLLGGCRKT